MIEDGMVYECVDDRVGVQNNWDDIVMLFPVQDGQELQTFRGGGEVFFFKDDDQFEDTELITTFHMPGGKLYFIPLTLADFERQEGPSIYGTPHFKTTKELHDHFRKGIALY